MFKRMFPSVLFLYLVGSLAAQEPARIRSGTATVSGGVRLHYLEGGKTDARRAVVFIPGWRLPAVLWTAQLQHFAPAYRVIAVDPRSQGESSVASSGNTPENRAQDLHELLEKLKIAQPVLVGWSQGAQDVAAYVARYGSDAVGGIALVDSPVSIGPAEIEQHTTFSKVMLSRLSLYQSDPQAYSKGMLPSLFRAPLKGYSSEQLVQDMLRTPTDIGAAMLVADIFGADRLTPLKQFHKPALVIASQNSPLLDEQKSMASQIPGSTFVALPDTAHAVFLDDPPGFAKALMQLLDAAYRTNP